MVDDGSCDGCCDGLAALVDAQPEATLTLVRLGDWFGIPYARNRGVEAARHSICFITDGNTVFPERWDLALWPHFHPSRVLAGTIADLASPFRGHGCTLALPSMGVHWLRDPRIYAGYVPVASCAATVIDRALFQRLGGYDQSLPLYGAAEPEFSVRVWLSGYEIVSVPDLAIHHWFKPKEQFDQFRSSIDALLLRNYVRFACYYLPGELLDQALGYYSAQMPGSVESYLEGLAAEGVWLRRDALRRGLPLDFAWFARRFGLECDSGRG